MSLAKIGDPDANKRRKPSIKFDGTFFTSTRTAKRQYYTIHPEWMSENSTPYKMSPQENASHAQLQAPPCGRRCRSAPPNFRSRNPITWENW